MPERFAVRPGGPWSPRGYLIYILALPLVPAVMVSVYKGDLPGLVARVGGLVLLVGGGWLTRRGLRQAHELARRQFITDTPLPLKSIGGLMVSAAAFVCSYFAVGNAFTFAAAIGLAAFVGFYLAYGLDPRFEPRLPDGAHGYSGVEIARMLGDAERKIVNIESAAGGIPNTELSARLGRIADLAREVLRVLAEDPRDIRRARKFLKVYLDGAERVSDGYARTHQKTESQELEHNFRNVLVTIEEVFGEQKTKLLQNDVLDLDVQIEVLSTQLKREGVI